MSAGSLCGKKGADGQLVSGRVDCDRLKLFTKNPFLLLECIARPHFLGYICSRTQLHE